MAQRVYWVALLAIIRKLCIYWSRYSGKMPSDLPSSVATAMVAVNVACDALQLYDKLHRPGKPENEEGV